MVTMWLLFSIIWSVIMGQNCLEMLFFLNIDVDSAYTDGSH